MARITVEDCLVNENNRFALVQLAAKRTKQLLSGARALTESNNKAVVTALREIADGKVRFMTTEEIEIARLEAVEAELSSPRPSETTTFVAPTFQDPLVASADESDDDEDEEMDEELDSDDESDDADEVDDVAESDETESDEVESDEEKTESDEEPDTDNSRNGDNGK